MITFKKNALTTALTTSKNIFWESCKAWNQDRDRSHGPDWFKSLENVAKCINPNASLTIAIIQGDGDGVLLSPLHVVIRIYPRRLQITLSQTALSCDVDSRVVADRLTGTVLLLAKLCVCQEANGLEFVLGLQDSPHGASVGFCSNVDCTLIPDHEYLFSIGYLDFRQKIDACWVDWVDRENIVFWRGSTTGIMRAPCRYSDKDWSKVLPRTEICHRLSDFEWKDSCDVGITSIVQLHDNSVIHSITKNLLRSRVERANQIRFRYQLDIDGNSNAWAGLFQALLMGTCVLKVESEHGFKQWYYDRLVPGQHYVPIASDLSDLEEKVEWALTHEDECQSIAAAGFALSRDMTVDREIDRSVKELCARFSPTCARSTA